jgi:Zn-dependent peptidase ImmA (M78 family)/DNA-binding XRE family transcriptional regulator
MFFCFLEFAKIAEFSCGSLQICIYMLKCKLKGGRVMSIGERIKRARTMADLSLRDLAEAANISAMAISKYERNLDVPGSAVLIRLAKALNVKIEYFFRPTAVTLTAPTFRKRQSLSAAQQARILEQVQDWLERYLDIENLLDIHPDCNLPLAQHVEAMDKIEEIALEVREQWCVGIAPLEDLIELCEDRGIKVGLVDAAGTFDALTLWANDSIPVIVLRRDLPGDRQRFSLAHELGHLILKPVEQIDPEKAANRFSGAFLAPRPSVELELGTKRHSISFYELHTLKHKYGLSMQAWIYRAKDLDILAEQAAVQKFKQFRQRDWYRQEPGDALPSEKPQRFERLVMHAYCEEIISQARASELLGVPLTQFLGGEGERHGGLPIDTCS